MAEPLDPPADSLIEYPCPFPIKIMGRRDDDFAQAVLAVVRRHDPEFDGATMEMRLSKGGAYLSLTCTVTAVSRQQLDALYQDLTDHPLVKIVL